MSEQHVNDEDKGAFDSFRGNISFSQQGTKRSDKADTSLHSEMIPDSDSVPEFTHVSRRINYKMLIGIFIAIIITGLIWYFLFGLGYPITDRKFFSLSSKGAKATSTPFPTRIPTITIPPTDTATPYQSPTISSTVTPVVKVSTSTATHVDTSSPTPDNRCRDALSIALADVGKTLCVQGVVIGTLEKSDSFMVVFRDRPGSFYWVTYDLVWSSARINTCYLVHGTIKQIGINPVLVFNYSNLPEECP